MNSDQYHGLSGELHELDEWWRKCLAITPASPRATPPAAPPVVGMPYDVAHDLAGVIRKRWHHWRLLRHPIVRITGGWWAVQVMTDDGMFAFSIKSLEHWHEIRRMLPRYGEEAK